MFRIRVCNIDLSYPPWNHIPYQCTFEDGFPFPQVGYVSSLEGTSIKMGFNLEWSKQHQSHPMILSRQVLFKNSMSPSPLRSSFYSGGYVSYIYDLYAWLVHAGKKNHLGYAYMYIYKYKHSVYIYIHVWMYIYLHIVTPWDPNVQLVFCCLVQLCNPPRLEKCQRHHRRISWKIWRRNQDRDRCGRGQWRRSEVILGGCRSCGCGELFLVLVGGWGESKKLPRWLLFLVLVVVSCSCGCCCCCRRCCPPHPPRCLILWPCQVQVHRMLVLGVQSPSKKFKIGFSKCKSQNERVFR